MDRTRLADLRSSTSTELFPSAATNSRLPATSIVRWSIRPFTPGKEIDLASFNAAGSAACAAIAREVRSDSPICFMLLSVNGKVGQTSGLLGSAGFQPAPAGRMPVLPAIPAHGFSQKSVCKCAGLWLKCRPRGRENNNSSGIRGGRRVLAQAGLHQFWRADRPDCPHAHRTGGEAEVDKRGALFARAQLLHVAAGA